MNLPTKITVVRIVSVIFLILTLAGLYIAGAYFGYKGPSINGQIDVIYLCLFIIFVLASMTDWLDGYLARKLHQVTNLGKFLDPIADKMLINVMLIFLVLPSTFATSQNIVLPVFATIILILRDIVVDGFRIIAARKNVVIAAGMLGKIKTVLEMLTISIVLLNGFPFFYVGDPFITQIIVNVLAYLTAITSVLGGVLYIYKNRQVLKEND